MKTLQELAAIKEKMSREVSLREGENGIRIVVGMATCGIAAGAREVLHAFVEAVAEDELYKKAIVYQSGCIGMCEQEPVVEVIEPGKEKVTYVKVTPEKARKIVAEHIKNGTPVTEYTLGDAQI